VAFIRNSRRDAFYRLRPGCAEPEEITFTEAACEFHATDPTEEAISLHAEHHAQVNAATAAFAAAVLADTLAPQAVEARQGPNERRALAYLDGFLSFDFVSDEERRLIRLAKQAIARARFANLQRDINALQRDTKKVKVTPATLADKLIGILKGYPLQEMETQGAASRDSGPPVETAPEIILSESFDRRPSK
jgi:hypothetical protein